MSEMTMRTETPQPVRLSDYRPPTHTIDEVALTVRLAPQKTLVSARLKVRPNPKSDAGPDAPLVLDGEAIELRGIMLDGVPLAQGDYAVTDESLTIARVPAGPFELEIETACNPEANTALSGLYRSNGTYCTQCEAQGFRRITYYPDRPDVLARFTTRIEARRSDAPVLLANGNLVDSGEIEGTEKHYAVWEDPFPKPAYLFALVAGNLAVFEDSFTTMSGREVALKIYVEPGKEDRCAWAMASLKSAMRWDEETFGREYDLDIFMIVAVPDFNMGAMENKGLNVFNDKYILARPDTATDQDYANIERIIAHEYFHNWTGNRITCRDWFQLCLKEGLTVFRDQEFSSDVRSRPVRRISDVRLLRSQQFSEDAGPLAHPVRPSSYIEINNFYTATVYEKGAEVVRMLHTLIGGQAFRAGMDLYFARHDGEAVTMEDFVACMAEASGRDLSQFFAWYEQAGTPRLIVTDSYDETAGTYSLTVAQETPPTPDQPDKKPLDIPFAVGLVGPDGQEMPLVLDGEGAMERPVLELTQREQTFRFRDVAARPVPSLNRGFSAPVRLETDLGDGDWLFLMSHDSDPFNRWEAAQIYAKRLLIRLAGDASSGAPLADAPDFAEALGRSLRDQSLEPAFKAELLGLPSETDLAGEIARNVDPQAIHDARRHLQASLGRALSGELQDIYERFATSGPYSPDADSAGRRGLRNAALGLIAMADGERGAAQAFEHFRTAENMTDTIAALSALTRTNRPERDRALDAFYAAHSGDHLLVDKWLMLNAAIPFPETLERVRTLMEHEAFSITRPNNVRALIGAFAGLNPATFNDPSGDGYRLLADVVLELDPLNPQVAARLSGSFKTWRMLEPGRRALAKAEIERIRACKTLSRDVYEIVTRILG
ncbi:aminopeptidase N [Kaustia mangrovi]|nr:aminopeptidase N [Kaustia mangrovi]